MCIAIYKPMGNEFPSKKTLQKCFENNPDGAGFMVANGDNVIIHKGFMGFRSFWKALRAARTVYGDDRAYVMHFRISTQGGVRQDGCHPFPLSADMNELRKLDTTADIGIAHNGIISLCSSWKKQVDYSDTMAFITEYLSLIIKDRSYYKDEKTTELISKLCGSKLAILDKSGHCELIGKGWICDNNVWYSNDSYKEPRVKWTGSTTTYFPSFYDWVDEEPATKVYDNSFDYDYDETDAWADYFDSYLCEDGFYDFSQSDCPVTCIGDCSYCDFCKSYLACYEADYREAV